MAKNAPPAGSEVRRDVIAAADGSQGGGGRAPSGIRIPWQEGLLSALPTGALVLDEQGVIVAANPLAATILARSVDDLVGQPFAEAAPEGALASVALDVGSDASSPGTQVEADVMFSTGDGETPRTVHVRARTYEEGAHRNVVVLLDDVTAIREREAGREMHQSFLLHDLKSPLWSMLINLPFVLEVLPPGEHRDAAEDCLIEGERLRRMLNNLQDIHRSDSGALTISRQPTDVVRIAKDSAQSASRAAEMQGLEIIVDGAPWCVAAVDETLVRRVLDNLLGNALRFARREVHVTVEAGPPLVVRVRDDGPGIADKDKERIFERFARAKNPTGRGDNAGLGLTFCRLVARGHGGDIKVEDAPSGGSVFVVTLG
jgi:PAS domain S-box-containing protein